MEMKTYDVEELSLGEFGKGNKIVFKTIADLQDARKQIDDGNSIYVKTEDGVITEIPYRMVYQRIYDGTIMMSAMSGTGKEAKKL
jgi:hypothetical protein